MYSTHPVLLAGRRGSGASSRSSRPTGQRCRHALATLLLTTVVALSGQVWSADAKLALPPIVVTPPDETDEAAVPTPVPKPAEEAFRAALEKREPKQFVESRGTSGSDSRVKVRTTFGTYCLRYNPLAPRYSIGDNITVPTNCSN